MDEQTIGRKIRKLREDIGYTLTAVARRADLAKSTLSKIERGQISPPISTLLRIADGLGVRLADFLDEDDGHPPYVLTRKGKGAILQRDGSRFGYAYECLAATMRDKQVEPFLLTIKPNDPLGRFHHGGQEFIYMLSGKLEMSIGEHQLLLKPGDSLYFDPTNVHTTKVNGNQPARFLCIFIQEGPHPRV